MQDVAPEVLHPMLPQVLQNSFTRERESVDLTPLHLLDSDPRLWLRLWLGIVRLTLSTRKGRAGSLQRDFEGSEGDDACELEKRDWSPKEENRHGGTSGEAGL